jgi:perosamine synthetase
MKNNNYTRRKFISAVAATTAVTAVSSAFPSFGNDRGMLALSGGTKVNPSGKIGVKWPHINEQMIDNIVKTTKSGIWSRVQNANGNVSTFEKDFAREIGTAYSIGTGSGTQSLSTCVEALGIGPGDEVITSPYTDMGTVSSILTSRALPVLVDIDPNTLQLDPDEVEKKINKNTKAIMAVHIMGLPANMERIMAIAKKHNLKVIEDSCQAPFARYQGKAIGTIGDLGCFSFQASKAIACGEGGAIVGNNEALMNQCFTVQNRGASKAGVNETIGPKYRMNEFEAAILLGQLSTARERHEIRNQNANYLKEQLKGFAGLVPQKQYDGTESSSYYHYALIYNKDHFNGASRAQFLKAINAEGIGFGSYIRTGLHSEPWVDHIINLRGYKSMFSAARLKEYKQGMNLPNCDKVCKETLVSIWGCGTLLGTKEEMNKIVDAIMKVHDNKDKLKSY